jgi:hypothetical protein
MESAPERRPIPKASVQGSKRATLHPTGAILDMERLRNLPKLL